MTKLVLNNVSNLQNESAVVTTLAGNNTATIAAVENTLSRNGSSPNHMLSDFDMNDYRILNLPDAASDQEPVTLSQLNDTTSSMGYVQASYVTTESEPLSPEARILTGSSNISITDGGAGSTVTIAVSDPELNAVAGLTSAADKVPYFTGVGTAATADFTPYARTLVDDADATTARTTLGLTIGTDVQAQDSDLQAIANLATNGLIARTGTGTVSTRTLTAPAAGITVTNGSGVSGNPTLVLADDLAAVEGLATTGIARRTGTSTWSAGTAVSNSELASMAAYTLKGNSTGSSAAPSDIDISALTTKGTPAIGDYVLLSDQAASGALKKATVSSLAGSTGVASIAGNTGAFTLSHGLTNSANDLRIDASLMQGSLFGLTLSTAGASSTFTVAAGFAVDDTGSDFMKLPSAISKTTSAWAVGSGNGAVDTGGTGNNTLYHVFLIKRPDTGVVDVLFSLSPTSPTMPTNYTLKRRIGSMRTILAGVTWEPFTQLGDRFFYTTPFFDFNNTVTTARSLATLSCPPNTFALIRLYFTSATAGSRMVVGMTAETDAAPSLSATPLANVYCEVTSQGEADQMEIFADSSSQIALRSSASSTVRIATVGWIDTRGRLY